MLIVKTRRVIMVRKSIEYPSMSKHVPDSTTQRQMFQIRQQAGRAELERRSNMNESTELARVQRDQAAKRKRQAEILENGERWLQNSEATIVRLIKQNTAFKQAIIQMAEAWAPKGIDPIENANAIIEKVAEDIQNNSAFHEEAARWSRARIQDGADPGKPRVKKKPKP